MNVYKVKYVDGEEIGLYRTPRRALDAGEASFAQRRLTLPEATKKAFLKGIKSDFSWYRLVAAEATDGYDESKTLVISREEVY